MSTYRLALGPWSPIDGAKLPGLTPVWLGYFNALTRAPLSHPAITAAPTWVGGYETMVDTNACGMISWGSTGGGVAGNPAYEMVNAINATTFPLFDPSALPLTGQVAAMALSWASLEDTATGLAPVVTPSFVEFGNGCYGVTDWQNTYVGTLYCPNAAFGYQYQDLLLTPPGSGTASSPLVTTVLSTMPILPLSPLSVEVQDPTGLDRSCVLIAQFPSPTASWETVWNGTQFAPDYAAQSVFDPVTVGEALFTLNRAGGWPNTSFSVVAYPIYQ